MYRAHDTHLDRPVALKVLPPEAVANAERKRRFIQEAKTASSLNDPNIITVYDIDDAEGSTSSRWSTSRARRLSRRLP